MKKAVKIIAVILGFLILGASWPAWQLYVEIQKARSEDPLVWEEAISAMESKTAGLYGPGQGVVFIGSSSIRLWDTLAEDMSPLPIFYMGITPSPLRWAVWPIAQSTNQLIKNWSETDLNLHFIDTSDALLGSNGEPDPENYVFDGLHLSKRGYGIWREIIRKRLLDEFDGFIAAPAPLPPK